MLPVGQSQKRTASGEQASCSGCPATVQRQAPGSRRDSLKRRSSCWSCLGVGRTKGEARHPHLLAICSKKDTAGSWDLTRCECAPNVSRFTKRVVHKAVPLGRAPSSPCVLPTALSPHCKAQGPQPHVTTPHSHSTMRLTVQHYYFVGVTRHFLVKLVGTNVLHVMSSPNLLKLPILSSNKESPLSQPRFRRSRAAGHSLPTPWSPSYKVLGFPSITTIDDNYLV